MVLLDEYQDTGHAQRIALSAMFGASVGESAGKAEREAASERLALTAVGDPIQSIYGAGAARRPPTCRGSPRTSRAPTAARRSTSELSTSWRNPPRVLELANAISAEASALGGRAPLAGPSPALNPEPCAGALLGDVAAERDWLADAIAARYTAGPDGQPPTAAVLVRRNADAGPDRRRAHRPRCTGRGGGPGWIAVDSRSGPGAVDAAAGRRSVRRRGGDGGADRPRWRLGAADLAALWRRAVVLEGRRAATGPPRRSSPRPPSRMPPDWLTRCRSRTARGLLGGGVPADHRLRGRIDPAAGRSE